MGVAGLFAVLVIFIAAKPNMALADFEDGVAAFQRGDYAAAVAEWEPLAAQNNASALFNLAQMYRRGLGVEAEPALAERYYRQAALLGHVAAQANLGSLYFTKKPPQPKEAIYFWRQAARQGDAVSQYQLGVQYFNGEFVVRDRVEGYAWMVLAADKGLADARKALAEMRGFMSSEELEQGVQLALEIQEGTGQGRTASAGTIRSIPLGSEQATAPPAPTPQVVPASKPAPEQPVQAEKPTSIRDMPPAPSRAVAQIPRTPDPVSPPPKAQAAASIEHKVERKPVQVPKPASKPPAPSPKPIATVQAPPPPAPVPAPAPVAQPPKPEPVAVRQADRWRVQIAARRTQADAQDAIDKATARHESLLAQQTGQIYRADLGEKGVFYRAQFSPFAERADAASLCQKLSAAGTECFVTRAPGS